MLNKSCYYYDEIEGTSYCLVSKSKLTNCAEPCQFFEIVTASPMFVNHMDKVYQNAQKITPIEGYDDIVIHGTSLYFINKNADGKENIVSVEDFAKIAKIHYNNNAPNGIAVIDFDGDIHVTDIYTNEVIPTNLAWRLFKPKR